MLDSIRVWAFAAILCCVLYALQQLLIIATCLEGRMRGLTIHDFICLNRNYELCKDLRCICYRPFRRALHVEFQVLAPERTSFYYLGLNLDNNMMRFI